MRCSFEHVDNAEITGTLSAQQFLLVSPVIEPF
jgi:hypothetical protein